MAISRDPRGKRMLLATMRGEKLAEQKIIVGDVSPRGIGARAKGACPTPGSRVLISFSNGVELGGEVRWARKDRFGVQLEGEVDPQELQGSGNSWEAAIRPFEQGHVYDQFRPVSRPYRPGLKVN
jgi:hypothetical protein